MYQGGRKACELCISHASLQRVFRLVRGPMINFNFLLAVGSLHLSVCLCFCLCVGRLLNHFSEI